MGFDFGKLRNSLLRYGPTVIALVQGAKDTYGNAKTGPEKFRAVKEALVGSDSMPGAIAIAERIAGKDVVNEANLKSVADDAEALVNESIELGYAIMKKRERLEEIARMLKELGGTGQPIS